MADEKAPAEVIDQLAGQDDLNKSEQKALAEAKAAQRAIDEARGYEEFKWHGITRYRLIGNPSRDFGNEGDAQEQVAADRVQQLQKASGQS